MKSTGGKSNSKENSEPYLHDTEQLNNLLNKVRLTNFSRSEFTPTDKNLEEAKFKESSPLDGPFPELASLSRLIAYSVFGSRPKQKTDDLDTLYKDAADSWEEMKKTTQRIARLTNGLPEFRKAPKLKERAIQKIQAKYNGDVSQLLDISGSKIVFFDIKDMYNALIMLFRMDLVVEIRDRFLQPRPSGYRDILTNIRFSNGHIGEMQFHLHTINRISNIEHILYKRRRNLDAQVKIENKDLLAQQQADIKEMLDRSSELYNRAWDYIVLRDQKKKVALKY